MNNRRISLLLQKGIRRDLERQAVKWRRGRYFQHAVAESLPDHTENLRGHQWDTALRSRSVCSFTGDDQIPASMLSSGHHLSCDDCLEDKRKNYQNCSVLCCVRQLYTMICTHTWAVLKDECWFRLSFLCVCLGLAFCVFFWFSLDCFVFMLFVSVVLGLVSSVLCQEIGWEERLRNVLFYVEWGVKP